MKKLLVLLMLAGSALASPRVQDVQNAMAQNNAPLVEELSKQVLAEHPNSAKAHYFLAEAYYHEGRVGLAHSELLSAKQLDSALSFTNDTNRFYNLLARTEASKSREVNIAATQTGTTAEVAIDTPKKSSGGFWTLMGWIFLIGIIWYILYYIYKCVTYKPFNDGPTRIFASENPTRPLSPSSISAATYAQQSAHVPSQTSAAPTTSGTIVHNHYGSTSSGGIGGNGFVTGMVAGAALDELLNSHSRAYVPTYSNPIQDQNYNAGTGSNTDWDSGSSGSSWDNTSSSSSSSSNSGWDDSSSSSSSDSSSSWDSSSSSDSSWDSSSDSSSSFDSGSSSDSSW